MTKWFQLSQAPPLYTLQGFVLFFQELKVNIVTITINTRLMRLVAGCTLCTVKMLPQLTCHLIFHFIFHNSVYLKRLSNNPLGLSLHTESLLYSNVFRDKSVLSVWGIALCILVFYWERNWNGSSLHPDCGLFLQPLVFISHLWVWLQGYQTHKEDRHKLVPSTENKQLSQSHSEGSLRYISWRLGQLLFLEKPLIFVVWELLWRSTRKLWRSLYK